MEMRDKVNLKWISFAAFQFNHVLWSLSDDCDIYHSDSEKNLPFDFGLMMKKLGSLAT